MTQGFLLLPKTPSAIKEDVKVSPKEHPHEPITNGSAGSNGLAHRALRWWRSLRSHLGKWSAATTAEAVLSSAWNYVGYGRWWSVCRTKGLAFAHDLYGSYYISADTGGGLRPDGNADTGPHTRLVVQAADGISPTALALRQFRNLNQTLAGILILLVIAGASITEVFVHLTRRDWTRVGITLLVVFCSSSMSGYLASNMRVERKIDIE